MTEKITVPRKTWDATLEALNKLLKRDQRNTCQHEETHRGGVIWEICEGCGMKWADDRGGKPKWKNPPEWDAAELALTAANAVSEPQWYPVEEMSEQIAELSLVIATNSFYQQGHKDGLEWAAQMVEYNDPRTGDWMWDDRNVLANVIRKGPELPDAVSEQPQAQGEPLTDEQIYKTIIQWDEGGGKRSRRELARRLSKLTNQQQAQEKAWVWNPASTEWEGVRAFGHWQQGAIYAFGQTQPEPFSHPQATEPAPEAKQ